MNRRISAEGRRAKGARWVLLLFLFALHSSLVLGSSRVEIREGRFYVDGEPFFVRGVGYAPWRPHQRPGVSYTDTNYRYTKMDFERIKKAHFNVVRTWDALGPDELSLAKAHGLMVLQGVWLDPKQDFSDPHNQQSAIAQARGVAEQSKSADNVLGYLLMTEPAPQAVLETGVGETEQFFRRLKRAVQEIDPRPVSMDSWPPLAFMDHQHFDFVTMNLFGFWPKSLVQAMGMAGMTRWFADSAAQSKPLIIGETGGYAVSEASQTAFGGHGGLSEYDQSLKDLESLRALVEGHAQGGVLVSWIDTWHYPKDPDVHDNEPWEWNGILGIPTDSPQDMNGVPRQIYRDVTTYHHLIPIEPKANHSYPIEGPISIQVTTSEKVKSVRYSLNHGDWALLDGSRRGWFQGFIKLPKLAKSRQSVMLQAFDKNESVLAAKEISFLAGVPQESISVEPRSSTPKNGTLEFVVRVQDGSRHPIDKRKVYYGCFSPIGFGERQGTAITNVKGEAFFSCLPMEPEPARYIFAAAGTDSPDRVRVADLRVLKLSR